MSIILQSTGNFSDNLMINNLMRLKITQKKLSSNVGVSKFVDIIIRR